VGVVYAGLLGTLRFAQPTEPRLLYMGLLGTLSLAQPTDCLLALFLKVKVFY